MDKLIWILEDSPDDVFIYSDIFSSRYDLQIFSSLKDLRLALHQDGVQSTDQFFPHLLIADLKVQDGNFLEFLGEDEICRHLSIPFLVVSCFDDADVLRACFEEGAVDYLTKPFTKSELIVKTERHLRKNKGFGSESESQPLRKDDSAFSQLTSREFQIFSILYSARGRMVSRQKIQTDVWKGLSVSSKTLDVHLFNLRKKLKKVNFFIQFFPPNHYMLLNADLHSKGETE